MIEKIGFAVIFVFTSWMMWSKTHAIEVVISFLIPELLLFMVIWFAGLIAEYVLPFMSIWAPLAKDFTNYSREGYKIAIKIIGWIFVSLIVSLTFCANIRTCK